MKVLSSLKSAKGRHLNCKVVRRKGRIYVINKSRIDTLGKSQFLEMPDLLTSLIEQKNKVSAFPIHEYWLDIGRPGDYEKANADIEEILGER